MKTLRFLVLSFLPCWGLAACSCGPGAEDVGEPSSPATSPRLPGPLDRLEADGEPQLPSIGTETESQPDSETGAPWPPRMPALGGMVTDCEPPPLTVEEWAGAADVVVVGTVAEVSAIVEPIINAMHGEGLDWGAWLASADDCPGYVLGGYRLDLEDVTVLHGAADGDISISYGYGLAWAHALDGAETVRASDGSFSVEWRGEGRFVPGHRIVAALHYDAYLETYTPGAFAPLYQIRYDVGAAELDPRYLNVGLIEVQPTEGWLCIPMKVDWLVGRNLDDLVARMDEIDWEDPETVARIAEWERRMRDSKSLPPEDEHPEEAWGFFASQCDATGY